MRTSRGRVVTKRCWAYFGLQAPAEPNQAGSQGARNPQANPQAKLFDDEV